MHRKKSYFFSMLLTTMHSKVLYLFQRYQNTATRTSEGDEALIFSTRLGWDSSSVIVHLYNCTQKTEVNSNNCFFCSHKQQPHLKQVWRCVSYDFDKHLAARLPSLSLSLIIAVNFRRFVLEGRKRSKSEGEGHCCVYQLIKILCYSRRKLDLHCIPELSTTYCKSFVSVSSFIVITLFSLAMSGVEVSIQWNLNSFKRVVWIVF